MNTPYTVADAWRHHVLIEAEASDVRRLFPGVAVWFGGATRHWWAVVESAAGDSRLVEASNPYDLCQLIGSTRAALAHPARGVVPTDPRYGPGGGARGRHARH